MWILETFNGDHYYYDSSVEYEKAVAKLTLIAEEYKPIFKSDKQLLQEMGTGKDGYRLPNSF